MLFDGAQEARKPKRNMPIGILVRSSSARFCTSWCRATHRDGALLALNIGAPVSLAIRETGVKWGSYVVNAGALEG